MKKVYFTYLLASALLTTSLGFSQRFDELDKAPVDITYLRTEKYSKPLMKVVYGRPAKQEDQVFGQQIPFGEIWRTGANEATEIKFYKDMMFGDQLVKAGTYVLHTIPGEKEWTIILNSNTDTWGAFFYDPSKDVARFNIPASQDEVIDIFSIAFTKNFNETFMVLAWDSTRVNIPVASSSQFLAKL